MSGIDPYDPEVSRKNRRLALILGGVVVLVILAFMVRFTFFGLPEDMKEWSRLQQRDQQQQTTPAPEPEVYP